MKGFILLVSVPAMIVLGLVAAVLEGARARAEMKAAAFLLERHRVGRRRERRRQRGARRASRGVVVPGAAAPPSVVEPVTATPAPAPSATIDVEPPALPEPAKTLPMIVAAHASPPPAIEPVPDEPLNPAIESILNELAIPTSAVVPEIDPEPLREEPTGERPATEPARPADPLRHWGLREPAFDNAPSTRFLYLSPEHTEALFRLRYAIRHRKGCAVLTGNYGCGKTTLARALARELDPAQFDIALVGNPRLTPVALLQEILHQLGVETSAKDKPALVRALEGRLVENLRAGRDTVVIVDEAQLIEDDAVFDELRLLLNFQTNDRFLITLVLAGSDELRETLRRHPHLAQRCGVRAHLVPLDREETSRYIRHRLVTAGREAETLTDDAVDALFSTTGGTPRVINAVCDLTLFVGAAMGARRVDGELVRRVAGDIIAVHAA